jgi:hypothetical protein
MEIYYNPINLGNPSYPTDDSIVIKDTSITIELDYPLTRTFFFQLESNSPTGFTKRELAEKIIKLYNWIYQKEEDTSHIKVVSSNNKPYNRNTTDGLFGIWGYNLSDLYMRSIHYVASNKTYYVVLFDNV